MKDKLYQLAQQITSNEISQDAAIKQVNSLEDFADWDQISNEIKEKCQDKVYANNLVTLILSYSERLEPIERLQKLENVYSTLQDLSSHQALSSLATVIGNLFRDTGQFEKAIPFFENSRKLLKLLDEEMLSSGEEETFELPSQDNIMIEEEIHSPISQMALSPVVSPKSASNEAILKKLEQHLETAKNEKKKVTQSDVLLEIGICYYQQRDFDKASNVLHECLMLSKEIEYVENITKSYACLGKVAIEHREMDEAISLLTFALDYMQKIKFCVMYIDDLAPYKEVFHDLVTTYLFKKDFYKAFYYAEYCRRWSYLANIEELKVAQKAASSVKDEYIGLLQQNINQYQNMLLQNDSFSQSTNFVKENTVTLQEIYRQICEEDEAWEKRFGHHFSFNTSQLQQKLGSSTIIVEFLVTDKGVCIFTVDAQNIDAFFIPQISQKYLIDLYRPIWEIEQFLQLWSKWCIEKSHGTQESFQAVSEQLRNYKWKNAYEAQNSWKVQLGLATKKIAEAMLPELIARIDARATSIHRLILIPENMLQLYPLHLMQIEGPDFQVYLQDRYEVIYIPTASTFSECTHTTNSKNKLIIAHCTQQNIPFMREEIRIMNRIWPGEITFKLGGHTTFDNFRKSLDEVSHIHLAVHSKNVYPHSQKSSIFFANECASLQDLLSQVSSCNVEAITLSASERHIENTHQSGDFMGLQWALLQIGIKNVVSPMWPVPDIAIFLVNEKFYNGLGQGLSPAMALQEAQNALRKMTISDILKRIHLQQTVSNEKEGAWLSNLAQFLEDSTTVSFDNKKAAIATLQTNRSMVIFEDKPIKLDLRDFILDVNGMIPGEEEFVQKSFRPFSHPFYWGAFYCSGTGLTESYLAEAEEEYFEVAEEEAVEVEEASIAEPDAIEQPTADASTSEKSPFDDIKIRATCPHCATNIHCFLPMANKTAKCPKCKFKVKIPKRQVLLTEIAAGDPHSSVLLING